MKDVDGWPIRQDYLVRRIGTQHKGWVIGRLETRDVVTVEHATRGGLHHWPLDEVRVISPTELDKARRIGHKATRAGLVGGDPRKRRAL